MSHAGKLIVIEGPDNVGRSLHTRLLSARLKAHGIATHIIGLARSELMGEIVKSRTADIHQLILADDPDVRPPLGAKRRIGGAGIQHDRLTPRCGDKVHGACVITDGGSGVA